MAVQPLQTSLGDLETVDRLISDINAERTQLAQSVPGARQALITKARELIASLETPFETVSWVAVAEPTRTMASRVALDLGLYQTLVAEDGRPKTIQELAKPTDASLDLVNRITRTLAAMGMITNTGVGQYAPNSVTSAFAQPKYGEGARFCYDAALLSFFHMPEFLEKTKYANPQDKNNGPFSHAYGTSDVWGWLQSHPRVLGGFFAYLQSQREDQPYWTDPGFYPVRERLVDGIAGDARSDSAAIVDVGGGNGYALEDLRVRVPDLHGRLILQDLPPVIEHVKGTDIHPRIELMPHDFFTPQPVVGARAYFLRHVIHDYNNKVARQILVQLKKAMKPGYSKILLNECVLADCGVAWQHASLDMFMLGMNTSQERSEQEWRDLIESVGLEIAGIWSRGMGSLSLIEVVLQN